MTSLVPSNELQRLEHNLGYVFRNSALLEAALTHRSHSAENGRPRDIENQRLEFLGDAVLNAVAAEWLCRECPCWREGLLTRVRSRLTNAAALARVARRLEIGRYLRLGRGEALSGGRDKEAVLADALEALVGALWLDGGPTAVQSAFSKWFSEEIAHALAAGSDENPKGQLQELVQQEINQLPRYEVLEETGPSHARHFKVGVYCGEKLLGIGEASGKRLAQRQAAEQALQTLKNNPTLLKKGLSKGNLSS